MNKSTSLTTRITGILTVIFILSAVILVFALPGSPPRQYPDRIPVRFWHMWTAEWKDVVEKIVDRYNKSQSVYEVIPLSVPGTAADSKFLLAVAGGDPPDVMAQWNPVIPKWAESNLLIPLNSLMTQKEWEDFQKTTYPAVLKIGAYKGNLYGITTGLNIWACYCRMDCLRQAGLNPDNFPETLEGLMEWGEKLTVRDASGGIERVGFLPTLYAMFAPVFGQGFYDWQNQKILINTPDNLRALHALVDPRKKLGFENVIRFTSGLAVGIGNMEWPFISGNYAITTDGQWRVVQLATYAPELEYITRPIPPPAGGKKHGGWVNGNFMIIPQGAKHVQGAWDFIKFWSGVEQPERAAEFYTWGGWLPLSSAIAEAPVYKEYVKAHPQFQTFLDVLPSENIQAMPPVPYQVYLWDRITQADESAIRGIQTPEETLIRLEKDIQREIAVRKEFGYVD